MKSKIQKFRISPRKGLIQATIILCLASSTSLIWAFGIFGHEHINRAAVFSLPEPLRQFFYNHIDFITLESTIPDVRKYALGDKTENPRHFVDLENFGSLDSLPKTMAEVKAKYDDKFIQQNGILPWYVQDVMEKLTKAFKEKKKAEILFLAADLGHYLGDANMPLHTSVNYDGQLTNQKGIHALWESKLPEIFGKDYNYKVEEAKYISDIPKETWGIIFASHKLVDTLLLIDKKLKETFPADKIYLMDSTGKPKKTRYNQLIFSTEYTKQFHASLNGMVEKQIRNSITVTANYWYTAWVNAGKPNLDDLDPKELTQRNSKPLKQELKLWKQGKLFGITSEREF